jgi:hypothetical protein
MIPAHIHAMVPAVVLFLTSGFLADGTDKTVSHKASSLAVSNKVASMIGGFYDIIPNGCKGGEKFANCRKLLIVYSSPFDKLRAGVHGLQFFVSSPFSLIITIKMIGAVRADELYSGLEGDLDLPPQDHPPVFVFDAN